ncbi:MAG TPA: hypothetical protein PLX95_03265 [bacterium]|nr:hypothetical protein [bacterium]
MKELGLIIDLNQPLVNEESVIKRSITDFYNPLARLLKSYKNISFSLNIPLSTLELWEKHGAAGLILDFKDMYQNEKFELINSSPYGLHLTRLPEKIIESQLILNEYGIGYYLGSRQGFEGEPSIMLRDVTGFLPVFNDLVDEGVLKVLLDFDYSWFVIKNSNLKENLFEIDTGNRVIKGVNAVDDLNNIISRLLDNESGYIDSQSLDKHAFEEVNAVFERIYSDDNNSAVVVLGSGNDNVDIDINYRNLFRVYESVLDNLSKMFGQVKNVGDLLKYKYKLKKYSVGDYLKEIKNITNDERIDFKRAEELCEKILNINSNIVPISNIDINSSDLSAIKLWDLEHINTLNYTYILNNTCTLMIISRLVPLMSLKGNKYYTEDESLMSLVNEETKTYTEKLLSYIDNKEIIKYLESVN